MLNLITKRRYKLPEQNFKILVNRANYKTIDYPSKLDNEEFAEHSFQGKTEF